MELMLAEGDPELVHRRIIDGPLDVHPSRPAIVVHYEVEATVISEYGEPMVADRKQARKIINIKGLSPGTDIQPLAVQIITSCELIQPARLPEVEQLLSYLQSRKANSSHTEFDDQGVLEDSSKKLLKQVEDLQDDSEQATMAELDDYLELLYDDLPAKIKGTGMILQLARSPEHLHELALNESILLALARVLREDWKKSIELTTNIVYTFFCFSTFSIFHRLLSQHKIGSMCMAVVEHELKRHRQLLDDLGKKKRNSKSDIATSDSKKEYDRGKKKYQQLLKKQETLLRVALYLLLNLAEDMHVEQKMRNKGLVSQLVSLLDRSNQELLILVVSFLKKLSIFVENKDEMATAGVVKKLAKLVPHESEILTNVTLRLLLNLSFDPILRQEMIKCGLLPKLSSLLGLENHRLIVLCILYHISIDEKSRSMFAYTDCVPQVMKLIIECSDELVDPETIALGINLACNARNAEVLCKGPGLKLLMKRALGTQDSLLMKMVRNISQHPGPMKRLFLPFISDLGRLIKESSDEELFVEALGILANLNLPDIDFERVVTQLDLMPFIITRLKDPSVQDDILLEVVMLCGTFSLDEQCANLLTKAGLPDLLITILKAKQEDDELVLQIVYVFYQLIQHNATRNTVIKESQAPDYLLELMNDKNREICKFCAKTLDAMADYDADLAQKVKHERFRWHNFQWLEMTTGETLYEEETDELDEDYLDPSFLHTAAELYNNPDLYYEMQSQLEAAHARGHATPHPPPSTPAGTMVLSSSGGYAIGRNEGGVESYLYDGSGGGGGGGASRARTLSGSGYNNIPFSMARQYQQQPWSDEFAAMADIDERDLDHQGSQLSPRQYALLMQSMQEPLAMYASTLDSNMHHLPQSGGGGSVGVEVGRYPDFNDDDDESEELRFDDGSLSYSGSGNRQRWRRTGMGQGATAVPSSTGYHHHHQLQLGAGMGEFEADPQMMLYSPGYYNPSPNFTYPVSTTVAGAGSMLSGPPAGDNRMMMRSPVPPPSSSGGGGGGGGTGQVYDSDDELDVHPATFMSGGSMTAGYPVHMPVPPPPSRNRSHRPPTRQGF